MANNWPLFWVEGNVLIVAHVKQNSTRFWHSELHYFEEGDSPKNETEGQLSKVSSSLPLRVCLFHVVGQNPRFFQFIGHQKRVTLPTFTTDTHVYIILFKKEWEFWWNFKLNVSLKEVILVSKQTSLMIRNHLIR